MRYLLLLFAFVHSPAFAQGAAISARDGKEFPAGAVTADFLMNLQIENLRFGAGSAERAPDWFPGWRRC